MRLICEFRNQYETVYSIKFYVIEVNPYMKNSEGKLHNHHNAMASFDVVTLFTSIPIDFAYSVIEELYPENNSESIKN